MSNDQTDQEVEAPSTEHEPPPPSNDTASEDGSGKPEDGSSKSRYKDGEELTLVQVRFPGNAKAFPFNIADRTFRYGEKVVAMSDRGMAVGYINSFPYKAKFKKSMLPIRNLTQSATDEDYQLEVENLKKAREAEETCQELIDQLKLEMTLTHVEFTQFGKKAVFYFNAPARVDFRELVKQLVGKLKMRIELRQISVRERAAAIGGIAACGLQTCCSSFLNKHGCVGIKMAKNQSVALIPSKLNGICGQIKCCIKYEDQVYCQKRKELPREGAMIKTKCGDTGKVIGLHIIKEQFDLLTDQGVKRRYNKIQYNREERLPQEWKFPERFDHIIDETRLRTIE
jgi:cell fate regulator YaaT (PSP1 superfamily)